MQGKLCKPATVASLVVALALSGIMYKRFLATSKFMPAGMLTALSALMSVFYIWNLLAIKPPREQRQASLNGLSISLGVCAAMRHNPALYNGMQWKAGKLWQTWSTAA